jgi:hypothetical protein
VAQKKPVILSWIFWSHQYLSPSCHCQPLSSACSKMQDPSSGQKCLIKPCTGLTAASHKAQMVCPTICFRTSCDKRQPTIQHLARIYLLHCTFLPQPLNDKQWNSQPPTLQSLFVCIWWIPLVSSTDKENTVVIPTSYLQHVNFFKMWSPNPTSLHHVP